MSENYDIHPDIYASKLNEKDVDDYINGKYGEIAKEIIGTLKSEFGEKMDEKSNDKFSN